VSSLLKSLAASSNLPGSLGVGGSAQESEELYLEIIGSRDVQLATIEKFKLDTIYKSAKYKETLLKQFNSDIKIEVDGISGIISCSYEAENKVLARDLVRFVIEEANVKYIGLRKERALQTISHLKSVRQNILASTDSLSELMVNFYKDNNLLNLEAQLQLTISTISGYEAQINNLKINEIKANSDNSTASELRRKREILEWEVQKLRGEYTKDYLPSKRSVYINSDWAVEKLIEQERLETELKRLFTALEILEGNIVMEEGNAAKNLPVVQIVQDAYLADYKSGPKRAIWALTSCLLTAAVLCAILILSGMNSGELPIDEKSEKMRSIFKALKI
jgi:capsule polysaccharide export protein KpsE/RkpR